MILFYTGLQVPFTIFLYTGFLRALPREYGEAALVDGATHWQSFRRITFPLLRPITGTVIILNAVFIWNDFLTPLIYLGGSPNETIPVVVYQFVGQYVSNWGYVFAAAGARHAADADPLPAAPAVRDQGLRERAEGMSLRAVHLRCEHREDVPCIDDAGAAAELGARVGRARQAPDRLPDPRGRGVGQLWDSGGVARELGRRRLRRPAAAGRRRVRVDGPGLGRGRRGVGLERARALPHRARGLVGAVDRPRPDPRPGDGRAGQRRRPGPAAAHAARLPVPAPVLRARRRRAPGDALRHRARRGRAGAERHARRRHRARAGLDGLPEADRVRGARRHRPRPRRARTCSARSSGRAGTPASSASTRCGAATTTAATRRCCASSTSSTRTAASR